jgi:hypothetical protein
MGGDVVEADKITIKLSPAPAAGTELKAKVVARRQSDGETEVFPATKVRFASTGAQYVVSLRAGETYHLLLLVEQHQALVVEQVL